ncbi:MAG: type II toxin-antitoxin system VapC family toxin [Archangium sp.]
MLDTNVLGFALGPSTGRVEEAPSRELWAALVAHKRDILIAAPTLGECLRGGHKVPLVRNVEVISFDRPAAELLGTGLPMSVLKQLKSQGGPPLTHLKFDALIMACAVRGRADHLVTYDPDMAKLQADAITGDFKKLQIVTPAFFQTTPATTVAAAAPVTATS